MIFSRGASTYVSNAETADMDVLADIHAQCFVQAWNSADIGRMISSSGGMGLIAHEKNSANNAPAAFAILRTTGDEAEVLTIATASAHRRKGFGQALMREALRRLTANRVEKIFLEVNEQNSAAVTLYRNLGFKQVGERSAYYNETDKNAPHGESRKANALVMRLDLR